MVVGAAAPTPAAELPDVPDDVKKCLLRSVEADAKRAKNADGALDAAFKSDRTKLSCAQIHLKWYADLKAARSGGKAIDKKDDPKQKRADAKAALPKATWE